MFAESMEKMNNQPVQKNIETLLKSQEDFDKLENWLEPMIGKEPAEQCVFVLRSMAEMDFGNQCKEATKEFGARLLQQFGGEESFFELVPSANFYDAKSNKPLMNVGYRGDFHSVGVLEFKPENKEPFSLIFDLTYGTISSESKNEAIMAINCPGTKEKAVSALGQQYGGSWEIEFKLDKKTGNFVFL